MTWDLFSIQMAYRRAEIAGASHLIISHNSVDFDQAVTLVMPGERPRDVWNTSDAKHDGFDRIDEVYRISLGWESQSKEHRAMHWEVDMRQNNHA